MDLIINVGTTIKKSNELSAGKIMSSLSLNQAQLFAYAILVTQQNGSATFSKIEFEEQFDLGEYRTNYAIEDVKELFNLNIMTYKNENEWTLEHVFRRLSYDSGTFTYEWEDNFKQYILDLKERYTRIDLNVASKFKSSYSWTLYEFLLSKYGYYTLELSKNEMLQLFGVSDRPAYIKNTSGFKRAVLDTAIDEVNKFTELKVKYDELKKGRSIIGFKIYFNKGNSVTGATKKQVDYVVDILAKLKEDYIFRVIDINNIEQSQKANQMIMEILRQSRGVDFGKLTHDKADRLIKTLNSTVKLIDKIIEDDKAGQTNLDKYADFEIPLYDWE